jgi:pilus assembly protein CpaF
MQDIFRYVQSGVREGHVQGYFNGAGIRPKFMDKIESYGVYLSPAIFAPSKDRGKR